MNDDQPRRNVLRILVIAIAGLQTLVIGGFVVFFALGTATSDQLGSSIAKAATILASIPLILFAGPALILGLVGRWLPFALLLCAMTVIAIVAIYRFG